MHTLSEYLSIIEQRIKDLSYPAEPAGLYAPIKYVLDGGGKRIRPVLTLATCEALGANPEVAVNQAMGVEMFHNFTLLHDDVMDHADMRRGRPTVHVKWDERTAILSGDAMLTLSNMLMGMDCTDAQYRLVMKLANKTAMEVYEGQQYDMDFEFRNDVSIDDYLTMIRLKTAVLLGCACGMGVIMAGGDQRTAQAMYAYGERLGLAFQLRDDYLDTYGDPIFFGKEIGGDIVNDKKTWLLITALAEDTTGTIADEIQRPSEPNEKIERVRKVYDRLQLPLRCQQLIDSYVDAAVAQLDSVNMTPAAKNFFVQLAEQSRSRSH
ncbi:MAG: polyprenyl synthetase family protein [Firmicutes bacterium]|nr:polyprenyl synthetase family protein [Bacillota bacterium]MCM1402066.1 polyprenyl synthetase family protein [Bacteroides sp.]